MWVRYILGGYGIVRGGKYMYDGVMVFSGGIQSSLVDVFVGSVMFMAALFLLFAGTGMVMGHFWSVNFLVVLLGLDALGTAGTLALSVTPLKVVWVVVGLASVFALVFTDPLKTGERPDIDADESVHGLTSFRN